MATITQVARHAGVGVATVSRVLNGSPAVREQTRQRVLEAIAELGYAPNPAARALSTGRTLSVGVVAPFFTRPSVIERLRGISHVLAAIGLPHGAVRRRAPRPGLGVRSGRCPAGSTACSPSRCALRTPTSTASTRPRCRSCSSTTRTSACRRCYTDDVAGGRMATEHLLELGHERIAFLGDFEHNYHGFTSSAMRRVGYQQALCAAAARGGHGARATSLARARAARRSWRASCWTSAGPADGDLRGLRHAGDGRAGGGRRARRRCAGRPRGRRLRRHRDRPLRGPHHDRAAARGERRASARTSCWPPSTAATVPGTAAAVRLVVRSTTDRLHGSQPGSTHGRQEGTFLTTPTDRGGARVQEI